MSHNPFFTKELHGSDRSLCGLFSLFLACVLLYTPTQHLYADPFPAWPATAIINQAEVPVDTDLRYTFVLPKRHPFCLVEVPTRLPDQSFPSQYAVRFSDRWLPFRLVHVGDAKTALLVDATQALGGDTIEIYPVGHSETPPAISNRPSSDTHSPDFWVVRAPQPISCQFRPSRFTTDPLPTNVLASTQSAIFRRKGPQTFMARNFDAANAHILNLRHERHGQTFSDGLADFYTWIYVKNPGTYLFALRGRGATTLYLGPEEQPIASAFVPAPQNRFQQPTDIPAWNLGPEVSLEPGIYRLHLANYYLYAPSATIGWLSPGSGEIAEIPVEDMLSGQPTLPFVRTEHRSDKLVVGLRSNFSRPYSFVGSTNVFVACTMVPQPTYWDRTPEDKPFRITSEWSVNGKPAGTSETTQNLTLPGGKHDIGLSLTLYDATVSVTQTVYISGLPEREYRVAGSLNGIHPLLREDDLLRPDLWITGDFTPPVTVDASLTVTLRDGSTQVYTNTLSLVQNWARLEGNPLPVQAVESLSWTLSHGPLVLASQTHLLKRPPFDLLPSATIGSSLFTAENTAISYVLPRFSPPPQPIRLSSSSTNEVILLDDFLLPPAATTNDLAALRSAFGPSFRLVRAESLRTDHGEALSDTALLCGLSAIPSGATVVLSIGSESILKHLEPETLERKIMALAMLLRDSRNAHVIITTPPPLEDTVPVRPYAEAALRAAALCGFPAADLFSSFQTRPGTPSNPLVKGACLTPAGLQRAFETLSIHLP